MASAPSVSWNSPSITHLPSSRGRPSPMNFSDEAKLLNWWATTSEKRRLKRISLLKHYITKITSAINDSTIRQESIVNGLRFSLLGVGLLALAVFMAISEVSGIHAHQHGIYGPGNLITSRISIESRFTLYSNVYGAFYLGTMFCFLRAYAWFQAASASFLSTKLDKYIKQIQFLGGTVDNSAPPPSNPSNPSI
jgi:hypothetical protein